MVTTPPAQREQLAQSLRVLQDANASEKDLLDACHALGRAVTPEATTVLVQALKRDSFAVRWAAAEALTEHGSAVVRPLLEALIAEDHPFLREGAHHVLRRLPGATTHELVKPVVDALAGRSPAVTVPVAANSVLARLHS